MSYNPALAFRMAQKQKRQNRFKKQESLRVVEPKAQTPEKKKESDWTERAIAEYQRYPDSMGRNGEIR